MFVCAFRLKAPPFHRSPCAARTCIYLMCFAVAVCLSGFEKTHKSAIFLFFGRFPLDIRAFFRYDICRKQAFFLLRVFVIHRGAAGCAGFRMPAGKGLSGIASCGSGFESPPIVPAAPQSEQLRRKRHHCFSPVRARVILTAAFRPCLTPDTAFVPDWPKAWLSAGSGHC